MSRNPAPPSGLSDTLANLAGDIIDDARLRLVEEGWFGRPTSGMPNYYESFWARHGHPTEQSPATEPEVSQGSPEIER